MKALKTIGIAILAIPLFIIGSQIAFAFGGCVFLGFIVLSALDSSGLIKMELEGMPMLVLSGILGAVIFVIYYLITGGF